MSVAMMLVFQASLFAVTLLMGCESHDVIMSDLPQREANEALVLLRENRIAAIKEAQPSKKISLYQIKVKSSQAEQALRMLVEQRLPGTDRASLKDIYPPGGGGLIPTKSEETARFLMASQGEIESLLKVIPNVRDARVVLSFEPTHEIMKTPVKKTAAVALLFRRENESTLPPLDDTEVKTLVASAISGLDPQDVTVVQRAIQFIDAAVHPAHHASSLPVADEHGQKHMAWYLLGITILALMVATYGIVRLFVQRKTS